MLTLNALYIMQTKTNSFSKYRNDANIPLKDIAFLLALDRGNLSKIENGHRQPDPQTILLYHILFGASLIDLFKEQLVPFKQMLQRRSKALIERLETERPPKSKQRISYIETFVKNLTNSDHGC